MRTGFTRAFLVFALMLAIVARLGADELADTRAELAARMFRAFLAADLDLDKKTVDKQIVVLFLYVDDKRRATNLASHFVGESKEGIHGLPLNVEYSSDLSLSAYRARIPAGIFLSQPLPPAELHAIVRYGIEHHVIVYSPFEGDVERGMLGGISVEAQTRPYVNASTLAASSIALKPFFLKVTKVYR